MIEKTYQVRLTLNGQSKEYRFPGSTLTRWCNQMAGGGHTMAQVEQAMIYRNELASRGRLAGMMQGKSITIEILGE